MDLHKEIKLNIAVVDDSLDDHMFIVESLKDYKNIQITPFYGGDQFLKHLEEHIGGRDKSKIPEIVILDINMPRLTGFEIYEEVLQKGFQKGITFFILSTNLTDKDLTMCRQLKLNCYKKPFSIDNFRILLQTIIEDVIASK